MEAMNDPRFLKGIDEFNRGLYFECHETLEEIWVEENGEDRAFYQGIIQVSSGYFKWEQGVPAGAIKLWRSGLEKLERFGPVHLGVNVGAFAHGVKENLKVLEAAVQERGNHIPLDVPILTRTV